MHQHHFAKLGPKAAGKSPSGTYYGRVLLPELDNVENMTMIGLIAECSYVVVLFFVNNFSAERNPLFFGGHTHTGDYCQVRGRPLCQHVILDLLASDGVSVFGIFFRLRSCGNADAGSSSACNGFQATFNLTVSLTVSLTEASKP